MAVQTNVLFESMSAMQKCIRRSMEREAGYWFWMMAENGWHRAALMRLKVTAYEDIGPGDPAAVALAVKAIDDALAWNEARNDAWRLPAALALLTLVRAKKSRETDHFQAAMRAAVIRDVRADAIPARPDWALDKHTRAGKRMGRGIEHFRTEGSKLVPQATDAYEAEAYAAWGSDIFEPEPEAGESRGEPVLFEPDTKK